MSYEAVTKAKILSSLLWKLMERIGAQGIQFIVTIVLARLLLPEDFGLIVLVMIFISIANIFVQSGFNTALIQKKDANDVDFSSVFYLSLFVASIIYLILFFSAPYISTFFDQPDITPVLRILSFILFVGAFNSIQLVVISRNMQFKKLFISSFGAIFISGIVGIVMAYASFGIWALVGQQLTYQVLNTTILWFSVKWRPRFIFSIGRVKSLFSFGWKLLVSALLDTLFLNIQNLIVGKMYSPTMLGFYNRGEQFPLLIVSNIDGSIQSVMLPTLSKLQDDKNRVKDLVRRSIVTSAFIIFPMMVGLAVIVEPLIKLLLTEKWLAAAPFLQIFCASYALWPIHTANLQAMNALGRSDLFLKLEIVKTILGLVILAICIPFGVYALALGVFVGGIIATFINSFPNSKLLNYSFLEQCKDIFPSLLLSLVMGAGVYSIQWFEMTTIISLIIQIFVGVVIYISLAKAFKLECFTYLILSLKEVFNIKIQNKSNINKRV